jgi:hypothetical protein
MFMFNRSQHSDRNMWWPETLLYLFESARPFEIFARSQSTRYFERVKKLIGVTSKTELETLVTKLEEDRGAVPHWEYQTLALRALLGLDLVGTKS